MLTLPGEPSLRAARAARPLSASDLIVTSLGAAFRPGRVWFADSLPKTRSAKVMRRVIAAIACRDDPGDLSSLEDPAALEAIRAAH